MTPEEKQTEALKALADWSKWLVTLQTGLSAALIAIFKSELLNDSCVRCLLICALICFVLSILIAVWLLGAIPSALQVVPHSKSIYQYEHGRIRLIVLSFAEHLFFALGAILLLIFGIVTTSNRS